MRKYDTLEAKTEDLMHCTRTVGGHRCRVSFQDNGSLLGYVKSGAMWYPFSWSLNGMASRELYDVEREQLALLCPAPTPDEFRQQMEEYLDTHSDVTYDTQVRVMFYVASVLRENGYGQGCDALETLIERWFA